MAHRVERSMPEHQLQVGIITVSDRAAQGVYQDLAGPALQEAIKRLGWHLRAQKIVPDEITCIQAALREQVGCDLVLTTGGTGVSPRDVTPEAIRELAVRELPGFGELMRMESLKKTKSAILSRSLAAVVENMLVICLPGKPSAAVECLSFVAEAIPHCVDVLRGNPGH